MNIDQVKKLNSEAIFIKITPNTKLYCYGVGLSLMKLHKNHELGSYNVNIPLDRN